jgi:hypothetical protein
VNFLAVEGIRFDGLVVIVAIIFGTTSRERLVRGLEPTNCDSSAVTSPNNHYEGAGTRWVGHG